MLKPIVPPIVEQAVPSNPFDKTEVKPMDELEKQQTEKDKAALTFLRERLVRARNAREQSHPDLGGKTYTQYYEENQKIANTFLPQKKNDDDVIVSAGTVEQKLDSLLSHINNLNLSAEVLAFNKENDKILALGHALEDIIHESEINEPNSDGGGDEEKKLLRQRELLKQGTVFVQEEWLRKFETKKKLKAKFDGKFKQAADYLTSSLELVFEGPSRTTLYGPNVFLGDITKFYQDEQPYMFVVIRDNYDNAKTKFGEFENFQFVKKGAVPAEGAETTLGNTIFDNKWRLTELQPDQVEIVIYQDQPNDCFQIIINGVPMLPFDFPLSAVTPMGKYNIAKQVYRVLSDKFAYGGAFVASGSIKEVSALIDEMLKLFVLKTRKSYTPPYVNTSGRVIDKKVLSAGRISMGIDADSLKPIGVEGQGVTQGEAAVLQKFQDLIDKSTVSDQFTGQQGKSGTTATEVNTLQQQAQLTLGLTVAACALLEKKLGYLRLYNILVNWFEPTGTRVVGVDDARKVISSYRGNTRTNANIPGEGPGERSVVLQDGELPNADAIRGLERAQEKEKGVPVRKIFINPTELKNAGVIWYVVVNAKERESSPLFKAMFKSMLGDMLTLMQFGSMPNKEGLEEEFARIWGKPRNKLFASNQMNPAMMQGAGGGNPPIPPSGRPNQETPGMVPGGLSGMGMGA